MLWLFAVFVVSLCALLWAAVSVARHIRRDRQQLAADTTAAGETETKRTASEPGRLEWDQEKEKR